MIARAAARAERLEAEGAHLHIPRADLGYGVKFGLKMLTERHIVEKSGEGFRVAEGEREVLAYYANATAHLDASAESSGGE